MLNRDVLTLRGLDRHAEIGTLVLRLFFAFVLIYGTQDNVFSRERMMEFRDFVAQNGFPYPLFSAYLSAHAQFVCGLPFASNISPLAMLFCGVFFLLHGPGPLALDRRIGTTR